MAAGSTMPLPMVLATAVVRKAPRMFMAAARVTAAPGERTLVETTVAMALAQSCQPLAMSNSTARTMIRTRISGMFQDDPFEDVGDVLGPVRGVLEELVDVLPLDDIDRIVLAVHEVAEGVAVLPVDAVLEPVDLDAVFLDVGVLLGA